MTQRESDRWAAEAARVAAGVGLFRLTDRGLVQIAGADRVRWLDGMLTNDVVRLGAGPDRSGCYAALLTHQGRIVSDIHVALREDTFWLEMSAQAVPGVIERLDKHIIADAVTIADIGDTTDWLGVEGPNATQAIAALAGREPGLAPDCWTQVRLAECPIAVARWGTSAGAGYRLLIPAGHREAVATAFRSVAAGYGLVEAGPEVLEILRIEAGTPRFGAELDESVLPAEAGLERAISHTKGCYIGQEVVARMASRGRTSHRLVGLRFETAAAEVGALVRPASSPDAKKIGEITSVCLSPSAGPIALAFVRSAHAAAGSAVRAGGQLAVISDLPFGPVS
ncbi:MAG: glycine cleavage T C-terminal barrel domain-containing protein [Myxococcota bacterium]